MPTTTRAAKLNNPNYKNIHAPKGKHWCSYHEKFEPKANFAKAKHKTNGLNNRCREGQKEYRAQYEAKYGKRQDQTKTIRVSKHMHFLLKRYVQSTGAQMEGTTSAAIEFYIRYACTYPACKQPRGATGRCQDHLSVSGNR